MGILALIGSHESDSPAASTSEHQAPVLILRPPAPASAHEDAKQAKPRRKTPARKRAQTGATAAPAVAPSKAKKPAARTPKSPTLGQLADDYLRHMEDAGKSPGTVHSYGMELKTACAEIGEGTRVKSITTSQVAAFFESDVVTKTRKGQPKAKPSIDKTRRVLRLALVWAAETGRITKAPIPQAAASA